MKTRAAVLNHPNAPFEIADLELDAPRAGEVLVRVHAVGVCHSDWHVATGDTRHPLPVVCGHEGAGVVESVGPNVETPAAGDHVILNWAPSCGDCFYCRVGKGNLCDTYTKPIWSGTMLDGTTRLHRGSEPVYSYCGLASFAQYTVVSQQSCVTIPPNVPLASAALVGCAVATGVGAVRFTAGVKAGESVAVIGCGGVGLNCVQGAALCGAGRIIAIDLSKSKLELARRLGASDTVVSSPQLVEQVRSLTAGRGVDHAIEAVGLPGLQELALALARPGGSITLAGLAPMGTSTNLPGSIIVREEKTIRGSYYGSVNASRDFPRFIEDYMSGRLKLDELVTRRYTLEQINQAFADLLGPAAGRGVIWI